MTNTDNTNTSSNASGKNEPIIYAVYSQDAADKDDLSRLFSDRAKAALRHLNAKVIDFDFILEMNKLKVKYIQKTIDNTTLETESDMKSSINQLNLLELRVKINKVLSHINSKLEKDIGDVEKTRLIEAKEKLSFYKDKMLPSIKKETNETSIALSIKNIDSAIDPIIKEINTPKDALTENLEVNELLSKNVKSLKEAIDNKMYEFVKDTFLPKEGGKETNSVGTIVLPGNFYDMVGAGKNPDKRRAYFQKAIIRLCKEFNIPLHGICGGMQHVASEAGAEIITDSSKLTGMNQNVFDMSSVVHKISIPKGSKVYNSVNKTLKRMKDDPKYANIDFSSYNIDGKNLSVPTNSVHNQAVINTPENIQKLQKAGYDHFILDETENIIEGFEKTDGTGVFFQFHPEGWYNTKNPDNPDNLDLLVNSDDQKVMYEIYKGIMRELMIEPAKKMAKKREDITQPKTQLSAPTASEVLETTPNVKSLIGLWQRRIEAEKKANATSQMI